MTAAKYHSSRPDAWVSPLGEPGMVRVKNGALHYKIVGVAPNRVVEGAAPRGAPSDFYLCAWGKRRSADFVIRYFPSKKGWAALDIRHAVRSQALNQLTAFWFGQRRHQAYFPTEDAAVMWAMHHCGTEVAQ